MRRNDNILIHRLVSNLGLLFDWIILAFIFFNNSILISKYPILIAIQ